MGNGSSSCGNTSACAHGHQIGYLGAVKHEVMIWCRFGASMGAQQREQKWGKNMRIKRGIKENIKHEKFNGMAMAEKGKVLLQ